MSSAVINDYFSQIVLRLGILFFSMYCNSGLLFLIDVNKIISLSLQTFQPDLLRNRDKHLNENGH